MLKLIQDEIENLLEDVRKPENGDAARLAVSVALICGVRMYAFLVAVT